MTPVTRNMSGYPLWNLNGKICVRCNNHVFFFISRHKQKKHRPMTPRLFLLRLCFRRALERGAFGAPASVSGSLCRTDGIRRHGDKSICGTHRGTSGVWHEDALRCKTNHIREAVTKNHGFLLFILGLYSLLIWLFHKIVVSQNGWSIMENPITSSSRASRWRKFQKKKELYSKERICL